jgi:hypothetical protein
MSPYLLPGYDSKESSHCARGDARAVDHPDGHWTPDEQTAQRAMETTYGQAVQA